MRYLLLTVICAAGAMLWTVAHSDTSSRPVSFTNDVIPVFTRAGCNQGSCHGAAAGKNGFRLSLRGYAPELDYASIMREASGRRIDRRNRERSLLLRKPLLEVPHRGGPAIKRDSVEHRILSRWLAEGMRGPDSKDAKVVSLEARPKASVLAPGSSHRLKVVARFSDGTARDVTHWAHFDTNNVDVASAESGGRVRMTGIGETAITVSYQDKVAVATVAVPYPNRIDSKSYEKLPRANYIDELVYSKLRALNLFPSMQCGDGEFIRRVHLDLTGTLPAAEAVKAFAADSDPNKRAKLVDRLMASPQFVDFWAYRFSDLFRVSRLALKDKGMWAYYGWIHDSVRANKPWDKMVRELLTATGNTFIDGPTNYYRNALKPEELTENFSQGFLGIRVGCARCHNHPMERWTQNDYYGMASIFARLKKKTEDRIWIDEEMTVYNASEGEIEQPRLGRPLAARPLAGPEIPKGYDGDRRAFLADFLVSPKSTYFPRSIVNRIWAHFMGRGLVEPVDDLRETNPPSNEPLFDALASSFAKSGYDIRRLIRTIVNSRTYQASSAATELNKLDDRHYTRYFVRRLSAEQILDAVSQVTGDAERFQGIPAGFRALQLPDTSVKSEFMDSFGRPARQITCECERSQEPNTSQALLLISNDALNRKVSAESGTVATLMKEGKPDSEILDFLYWSVFGRAPKTAERAVSLGAIRRAYVSVGDRPSADSALLRRKAFEDLLWALINSKEFLFNH